MSKLKPCPFCGGDAKMKSSQCSEDCVETWVECVDCHASTDRAEDAYSDPDTAASLWNARK